MSDLVPHKKAIHHEGRLLDYKLTPSKIEFTTDELTRLEFTDGSSGTATCLGCHDAPCLQYSPEELRLDAPFESFPGEPSQEVCPKEAINWEASKNSPVIDADSCMGCGLCISRCPYGAISLSSMGSVQLEASDPDDLTTANITSDMPHLNISKEGTIGNQGTPFIQMFPEIVSSLSDKQTALLTRNMLIACGVKSSMRRKGDTNVRMDGLLQFSSGQLGVLELETGAAALESPRSLLEDVAVLHNRYGIKTLDIVPISIVLSFPNLRSEYYAVIDDIEKVLGIKCRTLTLGSLCLLAWTFSSIAQFDEHLFASMDGEADLYPSLKRLSSMLLDDEPYFGAFRPSK